MEPIRRENTRTCILSLSNVEDTAPPLTELLQLDDVTFKEQLPKIHPLYALNANAWYATHV